VHVLPVVSLHRV